MDRLVEGENTKILNFNSNRARIIILGRTIVYGKVQDWKDNNKKYFFFRICSLKQETSIIILK